MAAVTMAACATAAAAAVLALASSSSSCDEGADGATADAETTSSQATSQECVVCLSELAAAGGAGSSDADATSPPAVRTLPGCGHGFHAECIGRWLPLRPECPLCRRPVLLEDAAACGQPDASRAVAATPAWARPARIACGFGDGRVVWTRSPSVRQ